MDEDERQKQAKAILDMVAGDSRLGISGSWLNALFWKICQMWPMPMLCLRRLNPYRRLTHINQVVMEIEQLSLSRQTFTCF